MPSVTTILSGGASSSICCLKRYLTPHFPWSTPVKCFIVKNNCVLAEHSFWLDELRQDALSRRICLQGEAENSFEGWNCILHRRTSRIPGFQHIYRLTMPKSEQLFVFNNFYADTVFPSLDTLWAVSSFCCWYLPKISAPKNKRIC